MESTKIRRVRPDDIDQLQEIGRRTFYETFSEANLEENLENYINEAFSREKLAAELNNKYSEFYFATVDNDVIGYLKLNFGPSQTELKDYAAVEIERIYVLKEFQGKNVGHLLYEKAMEIAKRYQVEFVWLGVWEENTRAIRFYKRNGFIEFDKHIFKLDADEQIDIMMKLPLKNK